jgi:hypothetical protein
VIQARSSGKRTVVATRLAIAKREQLDHPASARGNQVERPDGEGREAQREQTVESGFVGIDRNGVFR